METLLEKRLREKGFSEVEILMILSVLGDICPRTPGAEVCWTKEA